MRDVKCTGREAVPLEVFRVIADELEAILDDNPLLAETLKEALEKRVAERMGDDFRFCSCYRHENTAAHRLVYALLSTVGANIAADDLSKLVSAGGAA